MKIHKTVAAFCAAACLAQLEACAGTSVQNTPMYGAAENEIHTYRRCRRGKRRL